MYVKLNPYEGEALISSHQHGTGGWQGLLHKLNRQYDPSTGQVYLDAGDQEKIPRYAFRYGNGGWENQLMEIFGRPLGPNLTGN